RRRLGGVIPTRKGQPRDESFDRAAYRRRGRIEQVVGWYKECRALATRYEKLAVNYVALWMVAIIEKLLRRYSKVLKTLLSDRAYRRSGTAVDAETRKPWLLTAAYAGRCCTLRSP